MADGTSNEEILGLLDALRGRAMAEATLATYASVDPEIRLFARDLLRRCAELKSRQDALEARLGIRAGDSDTRVIIERGGSNDLKALLTYRDDGFVRPFLATVILEQDHALDLARTRLTQTTRPEIALLVQDHSRELWGPARARAQRLWAMAAVGSPRNEPPYR